MLLALSACGWAAALPEQGLGDNWITEDHLEPGLTSDDRILYSFPIEDAANGRSAVVS